MTTVQKLSHTSFNHNLIGFVPALVIEYLLEKLKRNDPWKLPEKQSFKSVVMFADISGFTNLSEKLSKKGSEGAELLAFTLNRYMELLVTAISRSGGDIFKFAGDAMIVLWPPPQNNDEKDEELTTLARQAIQSAIDIQNRLHDMKLVEDIKLSVKIGFGIGQVTIIHVGGVYNRAEYLATGDPLTQAFECEHMATTGGVVIISNEIYKRVKDYFTFESIETDKDHHHSANAPFQRVTGVKKGQAVKMKADALLIKNKLKPSDIENIRKNLTSYIPAAVIPFIEIDQEKWSSELRRLTILFVNLGIDLTDAKDSTGKGLERIQEVIKTVQKCVYEQFGSLNKLLMDDKGSTLIVVFGLPPMAHQDDPVRGVITGLKLVSDLKKINCACSVGITTGCVFAGVVGTSGNRREYSILGDSVNLSARFMQAACKEKDKKVLVDEETKKEAEHRISFEFVMQQPVKGKTGEINFYEPILIMDGTKDRFPDIRTHISISNKDQSSLHQFEMIGKDRIKAINEAKQKISAFFKKLDEYLCIIISGTYGIGKSFFIRKIMEIVYSNRDEYSWKYDRPYSIIVSNLNCDTKKHVLNGWRKVAKEVLNLLADRKKVTPEEAISQVIKRRSELEGFIYTVEDILNLKLPSRSGVELHINEATKIIDPKNGKAIVKIICALIQDYLEESEKKQSVDNGNEIHASGRNKRDASTHLKQDSSPPLIVVLDDMEDHDDLSWKTTKRILKSCRKIFIIGAIRTEDNEQPPQSAKGDGKSDEKRTQEVIIDEGLQAIDEECSEKSGFMKIDLEGLSTEDMNQFLLNFFKFNNFEFDSISRERDKAIADLKLTGPLKKSSNSKELDIEKKDKETRIQSDIMEKTLNASKRFIDILTEKTQGNPLTAIHLFQKLLDGGILTFNNKAIQVKESLERMIELDELLTIDAPLSRAKINGQLIDRLTCEQHLIMKTASVIGECFDLQTLLKVNPFKLSITSEKVRKILSELENMDYIEILDEQEHNITYRMTHTFLREVLYQRMIFNQRRQIHRYVAEAIQAIAILPQSEYNEKKESERLTYHWCLAENVDPYKTGQSFSNKAKRSIIVKKISTILSRNSYGASVCLKAGFLDKKSDKTGSFSWANRFCIMTTRDFKYFYNEEDSEYSDTALGTIGLKNIYYIAPMKETEVKGKPNCFVIHASTWVKKNEDKPRREFWFSAKDNDELEQWTVSLEFLKAKAIYDDFVNTFGKITFPLNAGSERLDPVLIDTKENKTSLSRMTLLTQSTDMKASKNNFGRKGTKKSTMNMNLTNKLTAESMAINLNTNQEKQGKLKLRVEKFFGLTMSFFWAHVIEVASRNRDKQNTGSREILNLGLMPSFIRKNVHLLSVDNSLLEEDADKKPNSARMNQSQNISITVNVPPRDPEGIIRKKSTSLYEKSQTDDEFDPNGILSDIKRSQTQNFVSEAEEENSRFSRKESDPSRNEDQQMHMNTIQRTKSNLEKIVEVEERASVMDLPENFKSVYHKSNFNKTHFEAKNTITEVEEIPYHDKLRESKKIKNDGSSLYSSGELSKSVKVNNPPNFSEEGGDPLSASSQNKKSGEFFPMQNKLGNKMMNSSTGTIYTPDRPQMSSSIKEKPEERISKRELAKASTGSKIENHENPLDFDYNTPVKFMKKETSGVERENSLDKFMEGRIMDSSKKFQIDEQKTRSDLNETHQKIPSKRESSNNEQEEKGSKFMKADSLKNSKTPEFYPTKKPANLELYEPNTLEREKISHIETKDSLSNRYTNEAVTQEMLMTGEKQMTFSKGPQESKSNKNFTKLVYGHTNKETKSEDGDLFTIGKGELVVVQRVYERTRLAECLWQGLVGLFNLDDINIMEETHVIFKQVYSDNIQPVKSPTNQEGLIKRLFESQGGGHSFNAQSHVNHPYNMASNGSNRSNHNEYSHERSPSPIGREEVRTDFMPGFGQKLIGRVPQNNSEWNNNNNNYGSGGSWSSKEFNSNSGKIPKVLKRQMEKNNISNALMDSSKIKGIQAFEPSGGPKKWQGSNEGNESEDNYGRIEFRMKKH